MAKLRFTFLLLFAAYAGIIFGQAISQEEAHSIGADFFIKKTSSGMVSRSATDNSLELSYTARKDGKNCYYVYNCNSGGFVIVSADERANAPVLGYSTTGHFDYSKLGENARNWMNTYTDQIAALDTLPAYPKQGRKLNKKPIEPLLGETAWGQDHPFNLMCPEENGKKCVTGCVATAMAQIMFYHKWPEHGIGKISYTSINGELSADLSQSTYRWDLMTPTYDSNSTIESQEAVALLMRDCGYSVNMDYGIYASGAGLKPSAFCDNFDYDKSIKVLPRECCDSDEWYDILYNEIENNRPVLYSGSSHEFICDGYDTDGYFHFNFGWNGASNGYYLSSANMHPDSQTIVYNVKKNQGGESEIVFAAEGSLLYQNGRFILNAILTGQIKENLYVGYAFENINTGDITYIPSDRANPFDYCVARHFYFQPRDYIKLNDGEYIAYPVYKREGENASWIKCKFRKSAQKYINVSVKNGIKTFYNESDKHLPNGMVRVGELYYLIDSKAKTAKITYRDDMKGTYCDDIVIPETIDVNGDQYKVTAIGDSAFMDCNWMSVDIPRTIRIIGKNAFRNTYISGIKFHDDSELEIIEDYAFLSHLCIEELNLPQGLKSIGDEAFYLFEGISKLSIPASVTKIGKNAFCNCHKLRSINACWEKPLEIDYPIFTFAEMNATYTKLYVPNGTKNLYESIMPWSQFSIVEGNLVETETTIGDCTYLLQSPEMTAILISAEKLTAKELTLPSIIRHNNEDYFLTGVDEFAVRGNENNYITKLFIPKNVKELYNHSFRDQIELQTVEFEENSDLWYLGDQCFGDCHKLESINLPQKLEKIDFAAFNNCLSLKEIDIPESVTEIYQDAFKNCPSLTDVTVHWQTPIITNGTAFVDNDYSKMRLHVPAGTKEKYASVAPWNLFGEIIEDSYSSINHIAKDTTTIKIVNGGIAINGDYTNLSIFNSIGSPVPYSKGQDAISLLPGFYVINIDGVSHKIVVR